MSPHHERETRPAQGGDLQSNGNIRSRSYSTQAGIAPDATAAASWGDRSPAKQMRLIGFRPLTKGSLLGIASVELPIGLDAALPLGAEGLRCFPCHGDKTPASPHGFKDAAADPAALRELWRRSPGPLVGVATGEASGFDVLDIDRKHEVAVEWWTEHRRRLPETRVHRTKSGGLHLLFRHRSGMRCWTARPVVGVDGRSDGGYAIWWPASGLPVLCDAAPAEWPKWLLVELEPAPASMASRLHTLSSHGYSLSGVRAERYAEAALRHASERVEGASEGIRNSTLNTEAFALCRFVEAGQLEGQRVADTLANAAIRAGLNPREVLLTLQSAFRAGRAA